MIVKVVRGICAAVTLVVYICVVACLYAGHVDPAVHALPSLIVLLAPAAVCVWAVLALLWVVARNRPMIMLSLAVFAVCSGQIFLHFPVGYSKSLPEGDAELKLLTYNILHGKDNEKPDMPYSRSVSYIINSGADVVCMQENYFFDVPKPYACTRAQVDSLKAIYPYSVVSSYHNTMSLSKWPITKLAIPFKIDSPYDCFEAFELDREGVKIVFINVHLTSYGLNRLDIALLREGHGLRTLERKLKKAFRNRSLVAQEIAKYSRMYDGNVIVCGDFNDVPGSWTYRTLRQSGLRDAYCSTHLGPLTTFNAHYMYFRIDHVLWRGGQLKPLSVERGNLRASDHYPQTVTFALKTDRQGVIKNKL